MAISKAAVIAEEITWGEPFFRYHADQTHVFSTKTWAQQWLESGQASPRWHAHLSEEGGVSLPDRAWKTVKYFLIDYRKIYCMAFVITMRFQVPGCSSAVEGYQFKVSPDGKTLCRFPCTNPHQDAGAPGAWDLSTGARVSSTKAAACTVEPCVHGPRTERLCRGPKMSAHWPTKLEAGVQLLCVADYTFKSYANKSSRCSSNPRLNFVLPRLPNPKPHVLRRLVLPFNINKCFDLIFVSRKHDKIVLGKRSLYTIDGCMDVCVVTPTIPRFAKYHRFALEQQQY